MEPIAVTAVSSAVPVVADALSILAFVASLALVLLTARETYLRGLATARVVCVLLSGALVGAAFADAIERWALTLASLGLMVSFLALALSFGQLPPLRAYLDRRTATGEPGWWEEFERGFGRYATRRARLARLRRIGSRMPREGAQAAEGRVERSEP